MTDSVVSKLSAVEPSNTNEPVVVIVPEVNVPASVVFAPLKVAAVVVPDLMMRLPDVFDNPPKVEPPSLRTISPPSASMLISPGASNVTSVAPLSTKSNAVVPPAFSVMLSPSASNMISVVASNVIVEPESISVITGVVKVLFVRVSVVSLPTNCVVAFGIVTVLSAVGSSTVKVVSKLSAVEPSNVNEFVTSIVLESIVVVVPETVKLPAIVTFAPDIVIAVVGVEPDCILKLPPLLFKAPNVVPPSFNVMSAPSASKMISVAASKVIEPALSISAITGVVNVLLVNVSVVSLPTSVVVASCIVTVLSAVGSATAIVVSKLSAVLPSKTSGLAFEKIP